LSYLEQSLKIRQEIGDIVGMAVVLHNMGTMLHEQKELAAATPYLIQAYNVFNKIGSPNAKVTEGYLADIVEQIGEDRFKEILSKIT